MPEYDWGPSSSTVVPAGQDGGAHVEIWPNAQHVEYTTISYQSLQPTQHSNDALQEPSSSAETSALSAANEIVGDAFQCQECLQTFPKRHILNRHSKQKHSRPLKCTIGTCSAAFGFKKDLDRHIRSRHPGAIQISSRFYCPYEGCKYSTGQGDGFSRKDNLDRHIRMLHSEYIPLELAEQ